MRRPPENRNDRFWWAVMAAWFGFVALLVLTLLIGGTSIGIHFLLKAW